MPSDGVGIRTGPPEPEPAWWPDGTDEGLVRDCNCEYCAELVDRLDRHQAGQAPDGEHASLTAFAGGGADD